MKKGRWPEPEVLASEIPPCNSFMVLISVVNTYRVSCTVDFEHAAVVQAPHKDTPPYPSSIPFQNQCSTA
jgi:hypothetical protein